MEERDTTNAERFLNAFNKIEYSLKAKYDFSRSMGFSDLVRKTRALNYVVRKYEDVLIDYGRLRNAIVHGSIDNKIIAEPHDEIVEEIEKIEKLINQPENALQRICKGNLVSVSGTTSVEDVIKLIATSHYSNIPVYKDKTLIGIANGQKLLDALGLYLQSGGKSKIFLENFKIEDVLSKIENSNYYLVRDEKLTVEDALLEFNNNHKLLAILITKNGNPSNMPLGMITTGDIVEMNKILFE